MVFRRERERLFAHAWQMLGPASQVAAPGAYVAAELGGHKVLVRRGADGVLHAFRNVCRHRGAPLLAEGAGTCDRLRCPYHHWLYDDDGSLRAAPAFGEADDFRFEDWPLAAIHVETWRGLLFVAVDPVETLVEQLGDTVAELADEPIERYTATDAAQLDFDANWKIYTDNFVEGYHIPGIHPRFFAAIRFNEFETTAHDGLVRMTAPPREGLFYRGKWLWMWPNWSLSLFNGGMNTSRIDPLSHERTRLHYHFYFADTSEAARPERERTVAANLDVVREDFAICLGTHRNYETGGYTRGPLSPRHEQGVAYFQRRLRAVLDDDTASVTRIRDHRQETNG
ncbi:MAG: aromatic ring-hydroxylating dioxygenase subunit alpha [Planctomycetes bacterium]|nr:aromatic ring-hydroxylating dioxygenase subunit alpha [Planctomycetota bacterium]